MNHSFLKRSLLLVAASSLVAASVSAKVSPEEAALLGIEGTPLQSLYHFTVGGALIEQRLMTLPPYEPR